MSWNNSSERQRFEKAQRKQAKKYKELGMSEEQIRAMYEFDLKQFQSNRRFYSHNVSLEPNHFDDDEDDNATIIDLDVSGEHSRLWWIEEIDNELLASRVKLLSENDQMLLSMCVVDDLSHVEISEIIGISRQAVDKRFKKIELFLKTGSRKRVLAG